MALAPCVRCNPSERIPIDRMANATLTLVWLLPSHSFPPPSPPPFSLGHKTFPSISPGKTAHPKKLSYRVVSSSGDGNGVDERKQVDLSVLRFTLGIPGFDESYLPRWIGFASAFLLLLNHFLSSNSVTDSQLRSEILGILLASYSISLPYFGKFLTGTQILDCSTLPEGNKQIFVMSENLSGSQKEDFAWGSYILLRNSNSMSVLIIMQDSLCARGYWNLPSDLSKDGTIQWFRKRIEQIGLIELKDVLYFPQATDSEVWSALLPKGTLSFLVQPLLFSTRLNTERVNGNRGFILLASSISYAFGDKDRAWVKAIANKFSK